MNKKLRKPKNDKSEAEVRKHKSKITSLMETKKNLDYKDPNNEKNQNQTLNNKFTVQKKQNGVQNPGAMTPLKLPEFKVL